MSPSDRTVHDERWRLRTSQPLRDRGPNEEARGVSRGPRTRAVGTGGEGAPMEGWGPHRQGEVLGQGMEQIPPIGCVI